MAKGVSVRDMALIVMRSSVAGNSHGTCGPASRSTTSRYTSPSRTRIRDIRSVSSFWMPTSSWRRLSL